MRVLVTGAEGFIGNSIADGVSESGAEVTRTVRSLTGLDRSNLRHEGFVELDLLDPAAVATVVAEARPDVVVHSAAVTRVDRSWSSPVACLRNNIEATAILGLEVARSVPGSRIVYLSTSEVYGSSEHAVAESDALNPPSPYAVGKLGGEQILAALAGQRDVSVVTLRLFNAYGPGQAIDRVIPITIAKYLRSERPWFSGHTIGRDYVYIDDVVGAAIASLDASISDSSVALNVASGVPTTLAEIDSVVADVLGVESAADFLEEPDRPNEIASIYADVSLTSEILGWSPSVDLTEGVERTSHFVRKLVGES